MTLTTYTLMSGQIVPTNVPGAPQPASVVLAGNPTRGRLTFSLNQPSEEYAEASLWGTIGVNYLGYAEVAPVCVVNILPNGGVSTSQEIKLPAFENYFALLNIIDRSQQVAASMTLVV